MIIANDLGNQLRIFNLPPISPRNVKVSKVSWASLMTLGTKVSVKEGIKAHFGGIFIDSRTRVRSEGLVNVTKNEKQRAPKIMRRRTVIA